MWARTKKLVTTRVVQTRLADSLGRSTVWVALVGLLPFARGRETRTPPGPRSVTLYGSTSKCRKRGGSDCLFYEASASGLSRSECERSARAMGGSLSACLTPTSMYVITTWVVTLPNQKRKRSSSQLCKRVHLGVFVSCSATQSLASRWLE